MRILFLTPRFPFPPDRGDKVRPYHFARVLAKKHDLSLVSMCDSRISSESDAEAKKTFQYIRAVPQSRFSSLLHLAACSFSPDPWQVAIFNSVAMRRAVVDAVNEVSPDIIYAFHLRTAQYAANLKGIFRILDLTDSVSLFLRRMIPYRPLYLRPLVWREARAVCKYERHLGPLFDEVWLISDVDAKAIPGAIEWPNLFLLPNGVDTDYFNPGLARPISTERPNILFVGYMGVESVIAVSDFYHRIFPTIRRKIPNCQFTIIGRSPPPSIQALSKDPNVKVLGFVPELREYYHNASVVVAPLKFVVGMQNKILEAMACGIPVVATSFANEGIDALPGEQILIADRDDVFADAVCSLFDNPDLFVKISTQARRFVLETYSWERVVERLRTLELSGRIELAKGEDYAR